jgi:transcriptional regulator with XRE-family HTH domain
MNNEVYVPRLRKNLKKLIDERSPFPFWRGLNCTTPRHLTKVHRGESKISVDKLVEIADELEVDLLDFFKE